LEVRQLQNFTNRSVLAEVMIRSQMYWFFRHTVYEQRSNILTSLL